MKQGAQAEPTQSPKRKPLLVALDDAVEALRARERSEIRALEAQRALLLNARAIQPRPVS